MFMYDEEVPFESILGKTFTKVKYNKQDEAIYFYENDNKTVYTLCHEQDCCESVTVEDICGDLSDLENSPILVAEVVTNDKLPAPTKQQQDVSELWTFYKLATIKGSVDIRWFGSSNGWYSVEVSFMKGEME